MTIASLALALQVAMHQPPRHPPISQSDLDAITDACRAPRDWLAIRDNELVLRASPDADPAKLECVLKAMSATLDAVKGAGKPAGQK